ncbi:hypothetical protein MESS2_770018 [Mesorhizobium metallidurans STM 2683]|uniref:DUF1403 family protein n=1 Tax=Mesorhizobium metallidurans STM 2683 TaxID=1297569 RepID=M5EXC3_9HYPH|nr:hypothetical protein MESS2_770018 [Mesorhizobium metallidurans STM 2683]
MIRAAGSPLVASTPLIVAGWAIPRGQVAGEAEAAFMAGAALNALDMLVRSDPLWAGTWRQRLALKSAAAAVRLAGRTEDEAALRDVWTLRALGTDPSALGPAGGILLAWRRMASKASGLDADTLADIVDRLGLRWSDAFAGIPEEMDDLLARSGTPAPHAAAAIVSHVHAARPDAEPLSWWLADLVLAQKLRWQRPVPLLMAQVFTPAFRTEGGRGSGTRLRPGGGGFERAVCLALAHGAAKPGRDDQVRELPRWRDFLVDASDLAPGTIPFLPSALPDVRVESLRKVGHLGKCDLVGGKRCRRDDAGALLVFVKSRLGRTAKIKRFDAGPVETAAVDRRACTTGGQEGPFGRQIAMEYLVRPDSGDFHPRAPFSRSRMKARTASTWPSATSSAAVRWP